VDRKTATISSSKSKRKSRRYLEQLSPRVLRMLSKPNASGRFLASPATPERESLALQHCEQEMRAMQPNQTEARWKKGADFFDTVAEHQKVMPIDPLTIKRYGAACPRRRFKEEFRFRVLKNLKGKRVLDVGCGDGQNAVLLAKLGARVTGIDISLKSIELARKKAEASGVSANVKFICSPLEEAAIPAHSFDLIWGDSVLHHLIDNLEIALAQLTLWAKPGATMLFSEPVNFNHALRRLRFKIPVKTDATPDERPLEFAELEIVRRYLPDLQMRAFSLLGRLERFILPNCNYERSPVSRRAIVGVLAFVDYAMLSLPGLRNLAGYAVFYGRTPSAEAPGIAALEVRPS
jgi:2-polyprenyl-3-methyl-5-hydroxy-6-metoxy-1,4-benzoquinol methylase